MSVLWRHYPEYTVAQLHRRLIADSVWLAAILALATFSALTGRPPIWFFIVESAYAIVQVCFIRSYARALRARAHPTTTNGQPL